MERRRAGSSGGRPRGFFDRGAVMVLARNRIVAAPCGARLVRLRTRRAQGQLIYQGLGNIACCQLQSPIYGQDSQREEGQERMLDDREAGRLIDEDSSRTVSEHINIVIPVAPVQEVKD